MSVEKLLDSLEKLIVLHRSLNKIAADKTKVIIDGNAETLQTILKDENKHIQGIQRLNNDVLKMAKVFLESKNSIIEVPTVSAVIDYVNEEDKITLKNFQKELQGQIDILSKQNKLNQELLDQSLHFINLSLDLLTPDMESINYNPASQNEQKEAFSIFDSKA